MASTSLNRQPSTTTQVTERSRGHKSRASTSLSRQASTALSRQFLPTFIPMNKTAVITGATKGIGKAIAQRFLQEGFDLFITSRSEQDLSALANEWEQNFPKQKVHYKAFDLSKHYSGTKLGKYVLGCCSRIDVLVNNAGIFLPGDVGDGAQDHLADMLQVNLFATYDLTRALLPKMRAQKHGHIFNLSSQAGLAPYPKGGNYSISKYALQGFSENLRQELKPFGIKVTTVCPGPTMSHSWEGSGVDENRILRAEDVAEMVVAAAKLSPQACVEQITLQPVGDL